jgi:hypothetical protein
LSRGFFVCGDGADQQIECRTAQGWKTGEGKRTFLAMEAFIKIALLAALVVLTLGVIPNRRIGAVIAVGTCAVAAFALHFVAP